MLETANSACLIMRLLCQPQHAAACYLGQTFSKTFETTYAFWFQQDRSIGNSKILVDEGVDSISALVPASSLRLNMSSRAMQLPCRPAPTLQTKRPPGLMALPIVPQIRNSHVTHDQAVIAYSRH